MTVIVEVPPLSAIADVDALMDKDGSAAGLSDDPPAATATAPATPKSPRPIFPFELDFFTSLNGTPEARLNAI